MFHIAADPVGARSIRFIGGHDLHPEVVTRNSDFFTRPLRQRVQEKPKKTLRNLGWAEILEYVHLDQETRRSTPKTLLNSAHDVNLEELQIHHHDQQPECQRFAPQSAAEEN